MDKIAGLVRFSPSGKSAGKRLVSAWSIWLVAALVVGAATLALSQLAAPSASPLRPLPDLTYTPEPESSSSLHDGIEQLERNGDTSPGTGKLSPSASFWFRLPLGELVADKAYVAELRLLRVAESNVWLVKSTPQLAHGNAAYEHFSLKQGKGGSVASFSVDETGSYELVGWVRPTSVSRIRASLWLQEPYERSTLTFERGGGALAGALIIFSIFSALIGLLNRDRTFWLFAGWLVTSFRIAAVNSGWDIVWGGLSLEPTLSQALMRVTLPVHALLTFELFRSLFRRDLSKRAETALVCFGALFLSECVLALALDTHVFLLAFWASAAAGLLVLLGNLATIIRRHRSMVATWYAASWGFALLGYLAELAFQSGAVTSKIPVLNAQVGFVASTLLTGVALAERLRQERAARMTAQGKAITALRRTRETYRSIPIGLFTADHKGNVVQFNPAFSKTFGLEARGASLRVTWNDLFESDSHRRALALARPGRSIEIEVYEREVTATRRCFLLKALSKGSLLECSVQDITEKKQAEVQLKYLANHDPLTDLPNRRGLQRELDSAAEAVQAGGQACLGYLDLDRFKLVNDLFGHMAGDQVLRDIATRIRQAVEAPHVVARIGGDEFVLLLRDLRAEDAQRICEQVVENIIASPLRFADKAFSVTGSIGLVALTPDISTRDALLACDRACADAKAHGGSNVVLYSEGSVELRRQLEEVEIAANLRQRLPVDKFFVQLQPIVSLTSPNASLNYEVLLRMRGHDGGIVSPGKFVAAAERNGVMANIDRWVLRHMLEWLTVNPEHLNALGFASINLSGASLNDERFIEDSLALIRTHSSVAKRICFEITESVALYDLKNTSRFVDRVKAEGVKVALDDFGAGYTSFNYLKELPADLVKIDGAFIKNVNAHRANLAITRAIVDLAHQIGMTVVAEWAETAPVVKTLVELGVDFGQGYAIARPLDPEIVLPARSGRDLLHDAAVASLLDSKQEALGLRIPATVA